MPAGDSWQRVIELRDVTAEGVDFSRRHFEHLGTEGSVFVDCDFSRCRFEAGYLDNIRPSVFRRCRFDQAQLRKLLAGPSRFEHCSFERMRLTNWWPHSAEFVGCSFSGSFRNLFISGVPLFPNNHPERLISWRSRNEFHDNDFSRAELIFPDFRWGISLSANSLPTGPEYVYLAHWQVATRERTQRSRFVADAE